MLLKLSFLVFIPSVLALCPNGSYFDSGSSRCYKFSIGTATFLQAELNCVNDGGHLTSISNAFENAVVSETGRSTFQNAADFWIGANLLMGPDWSWTDNTTFSFNNWAPTPPNTAKGQCGAVQSTNGIWSPSDCNDQKPYVCVLPEQTLESTPAPCPTQHPHPGYCETGWTYFNGADSCYKVLLNENFENAEATCVAAEAHLASVHSLAEDEFLTDLSTTGLVVTWEQLVWLGLHKVNNEWAWTDNSPVDYFNWGPGLPDSNGGPENCVQLISDRIAGGNPYGVVQKCNDIICRTVMRAFICKKAALH